MPRTSKPAWECGHIDRPNYSFGSCESCYRKQRKPSPKAYAAHLQRARVRAIEHPERIANKHLRKRYGIDFLVYQDLLESQGGVCAICKKVNQNGKRLSVDHDHDTGRVRGLLCFSCNTGIGLIGDSIGSVAKVLEYLTQGE